MSDTIISSMVICPKCKNSSPEGSKFCMHCGASLEGISDKKNIKLIQLNSKTKKQVLIESNYKFNDKSSDFEGLESDSNKIEIKIDNNLIKIIDNSKSGVFLRIPPKSQVDLKSGDELYINGNLFKVE